MKAKELPCSRCGQDLHIPARYNAENIAQLKEQLRLCNIDQANTEAANDVLRQQLERFQKVLAATVGVWIGDSR